MRLQVASDLFHQYEGAGLNTSRPLRVANNVDCLVLAGNVHLGTEVLRLYGELSVPVIFVHGNAELIGTSGADLRRAFARGVGSTSVRYLERRTLYEGGARVLGCCLWTDHSSSSSLSVDKTTDAAGGHIDHRLIRNGRRLFQARDAVVEHRRCKSWLERELAKPFNGKTVVVTHFAPSMRSVPMPIREAPIAAWYATALDEIVSRADLWIHGRVPDTFDYTIKTTRVVCNARGLPWEKQSPRRPFRPEFTIDL